MLWPTMILGYFPFLSKTLPIDGFGHEQTWEHAANRRVGASPSYQFLGKGEETLTIQGVAAAELVKGMVSLAVLEKMADTGGAYPLMDGIGTLYGQFVIQGISRRHTEFMGFGVPRKIEFDVKLLRTDDKSAGLLSDLRISAIKGLF